VTRSPNVLLFTAVAACALASAAATPARAAGLTSDEVARRAQASSFDVAARAAERAAAESAVAQAAAAFAPRLSGTARYTRLSDLTPPTLGTLVLAPADTPAGSAPDPARLMAVPFSFPIIKNQAAAQATLQVPLSDYLLRLPQAHAAASGSARAAALAEGAARLRVGTDARVAYWAWVRARLEAGVAEQAVAQARGHLGDAQSAAAAGAASPADVLRVQSQVAQAELLLTRARSLTAVTEQQLRTIMHDDSGRSYEIGEDASGGAGAGAAGEGGGARDAAVAGRDTDALRAEAGRRRLEVRALDESAASAREQAKVARATGLPRLDAVGNAIYASPNPRVVPQDATFRGTWDATVQLAWAPTDMFGTEAARRGALARAAQADAERAALLDGIGLEVTQAVQAVVEARAAGETARRGQGAAEESYRVRRMLFQNGRATSVELTDAETELTRARLDVVGADIDLRVATARLRHAVGRDTD
jgi:outer membrane protein TolC